MTHFKKGEVNTSSVLEWVKECNAIGDEKKCVDIIKNIIDGNDVLDMDDMDTLNCLGAYHYMRMNVDIAMDYFIKSANLGNLFAMKYVADNYKDNNNRLMRKFYDMAIDQHSDIESMIIMGDYYVYTENDNKMGIKYYNMAIKNGSGKGMSRLAIYYEHIGKDVELAEKYYLMSIDNGEIKAMEYLGCYYGKLCKYDLMEKYLLMAIENGRNGIGEKLGDYYHKIKRYDMMEKFYMIASEDGNSNAMFKLANYYDEKGCYKEAKKYLKKASLLGDMRALNKLAQYYLKEDDEYKFIKSSISAIKRGNRDAKIRFADYQKKR